MQVTFLNTRALFDQHWWAVAKLIEPVVKTAARGEFDLEDLAGMVEDQRAFAAIAMEDNTPLMGMVFEFCHYPRKTTVNVMALGGRDLASVALGFLPQFLDWARQAGASAIEAAASPAMTRLLRTVGMVHTYDLLRLDLGEPA